MGGTAGDAFVCKYQEFRAAIGPRFFNDTYVAKSGANVRSGSKAAKALFDISVRFGLFSRESRQTASGQLQASASKGPQWVDAVVSVRATLCGLCPAGGQYGSALPLWHD